MITKNLKQKKKRPTMGQIVSKEKKQKKEDLMAQMKSITEVNSSTHAICHIKTNLTKLLKICN